MSNQPDYKIYTTSKNVTDAVEALKTAIKEKGLVIFAAINHAEEARHSGLTMPDEQLLIFGDPKVGTYLMQENPIIGIELPLKILVWSYQGITQVAFPIVTKWKERFSITKQAPILDKMMELLDKLVQSVT